MRILTFALTISLILTFSSSSVLIAQVLHPEKISKAVHFDKSKELRTIPEVPYGMRKRNWKDKLVPNKFDIDDELKHLPPLVGPDPVQQDRIIYGGSNLGTVVENFAGVSNNYGVAPPDTDGDVGLDHYFQMVNQGFAIWDKSGNLLYGPVDNITLWDGFTGPWSNTNDGDPIVLYDEYADRWIATQFALPYYPNGPFWELIAVSETSDPLGAWYRYAFQFSGMPDYPKFGIWNDGYYFTTHQFVNGSFNGGGLSICDRDAMIAGDPDAEMVYFSMGNSYGLLPADADGALPPPAGSSSYVLDVGGNALKMWEVDVDWNNTSNSTVTTLPNLNVEPFNSSNITINQPGTGQNLANMASMTMYRLQYRNFGAYKVMLTNHTVDVGGGRAGIRWYELRDYGAGWEIYQQGTYAPIDNENRWMGSIAMNQNGDIALGYSVSSSTTYPSIRVTGQSAGAPLGLGVFDIAEASILVGTQSQTGVNRWGDYSAMAVDPTDGNTFWYTTEFTSGGWSWKTQIASVAFGSIPVPDFTSNEIIIPVGETVNFTDISAGTPSEWSWSFEGGDPPTSTDQNPENIQYNTEGTFNVKLTSTNVHGSDSVTKVAYITASSTVLPDVAFSSDINTFCLGETVTFIDETMSSPIQWYWQFEPSDIEFVNGTDENSQNPQVIFLSPTNYSVTLTSWNLNGSAELTKTDMIESGGHQPYFIDSFEENGFETFNWTVVNPNWENDVTWKIYEIGGTTPGTHAPGVNFRESITNGQRDRLISPPFNLDGLSTATLEFQHAYAQHLDVIDLTDSLLIYISVDCGDTWTRIYSGGEDGSGNFATHEPADYDFFPEVASDWCMTGWGAPCIILDISAWAGNDDVQLSFETYSNYGNPIFIDNIAVTQTVGQAEISIRDEQVGIYPNPSDGSFTIVLPNENSYNNLMVINQLGQILYNEDISENSNQILMNAAAEWNTGVYTIRLSGKSGSETKKIVIK